MEMTGAFFPDVHLDAPKMARLAAGAYEILGYDAIMPVFSVTQESAALGCTMHWGDVDMMPVALDHPFVEPEQVIIPDDFLDLPPIKTVLDAITLLRQTYGSHVAIIGKVMGPWTLSYHLRGINDFLLETLTEPDKVRRVLDQLKLVPLLFGRAQIAAGADVLCLADHATGDLVRGTMYRDMLQPIHKELVQELGCPLILHICGNTLDRLSYIADAGFDAFHFDSKVDAVAAVQAVGDRLSLIGNVNNPEVLYAGTPQQAEAQARYAIAAGVRIVGPECAVPLRTPIANLKAICQAVA
jgi:[methyl-Co(III) methanol-specific corrinoid protein]:coenzyme M methyltransferase